MTEEQKPDISPEGIDPEGVAWEIKIVMFNNGDFEVQGPMSDPVAYYGLLKLAETRLTSKLVGTEIIQSHLKAQRDAALASLVNPMGEPIST